MASKFHQGFFTPTNPEKYAGAKPPYWRSSWEHRVMMMFDTNPRILKWASESIKIPYRNPFTDKYTVYVPDFVVTYVDAQGKQITEIIEVKPAKETCLELAKSQKSKAAFALNQFKWEAAMYFAKQNGIGFRIMTEYDIFNNPKGKG